MKRAWLAIAIGSTALACASLDPYLDGVESDVTEWRRYETRVEGHRVMYSLPRFVDAPVHAPVPPRAQAIARPKDSTEQAFASVWYGVKADLFSSTAIHLTMEVRRVDPDTIDPAWTLEQFAEFYWAKVYGNEIRAGSSFPEFPPNAQHEFVDFGGGAWYHVSFRAREARGEPYVSDVYLRPLTSSQVLAVLGWYVFYEQLSPEVIARRRELVRRIVERVRIDPTPEQEAELNARPR